MKKTRKCAHCGKEFVVRSGMQRYCSEQCQAKAKEERKRRQREFVTAIEPAIDLKSQDYLTFSKAAVLMGCSRQYIYKLVNTGRLTASRLSPRMALIRKADIEHMLEGNPYHRVLPTDLAKAMKVGMKKTSSPSASCPKAAPESATPAISHADQEGEVPTFISGEEVMTIYKVQRSWLYTSAKRNGIPVCRIGGKNYYSRRHLDEHFGVTDALNDITEWVTPEQAQQLYDISPASLRSTAYRRHIPTKREYGQTYYSKKHLDDLRRPDIAGDERYYTTRQVAEKYGMTASNVCCIVKSMSLTKVRVGVQNMLLRDEIDKVMADRLAQYGSYRIC